MPVELINPNRVEVGPDEKKILQALHPELQKRANKGVEEAQGRARYKIEINFGKDRSMSNFKASVGGLTIWESGRRFHGGGDEKMYLCGYEDCDKPIRSEYFGYHHVVCPHCKRECFLGKDSREAHIRAAARGGKNTDGLKILPTIYEGRFFRLPPPKVADLIEKRWRQLDCNADIYLKYHPTDIRYRALEETAKTPDQLEKARRLRGLAIYPLKNILKDTIAGASAKKRFLEFITA